MVTFETVMEIKILHKQGMSSRAIAKKTGHLPQHRQTVSEGEVWATRIFPKASCHLSSG